MNRGHKIIERILSFAAFIPLASYKIWASTPRPGESLLTVACITAFICVVIIIIAYRIDKPSYFDWAICAYFVSISLLLYLMPGEGRKIVTNYAVTGIYLTLFLASFIPPVVGMEPFTIYFAKKTAPAEVWSNPLFIRINMIMTFVWSGIFAFCLLLSFYPSVITRAFIPIMLILLVGVTFNVKFPDYYLKKKGLPPREKMKELFVSNERKQ